MVCFYFKGASLRSKARLPGWLSALSVLQACQGGRGQPRPTPEPVRSRAGWILGAPSCSLPGMSWWSLEIRATCLLQVHLTVSLRPGFSTSLFPSGSLGGTGASLGSTVKSGTLTLSAALQLWHLQCDHFLPTV